MIKNKTFQVRNISSFHIDCCFPQNIRKKISKTIFRNYFSKLFSKTFPKQNLFFFICGSYPTILLNFNPI